MTRQHPRAKTNENICPYTTLVPSDHRLAVILRRLMMLDTGKAFIKAQEPKSLEEVTMLIREQRLGFMPLSFLHYAIWYLFLGYHALAFGFAVAGHPFEASTFMHAIDTAVVVWLAPNVLRVFRSEEHTSELQSLMRNSYAVFCLKKRKYCTPQSYDQET